MRKLAALSVLCLSLTINRIVAQLPLPKVQQIAWQEAELGVLFSYDLHVFDGKKYDQAFNRINPIEDYNIFNPGKLNTDQWIQSVKAAGVTFAILTVTHETGFALYQSDVNPYSLKAIKWKDGKGDIVRDFVSSCEKYGIRPAIYIGIRWNSYMGIHDFVTQGNSEFSRNRQIYYNRYCERMTTELLTRYGKFFFIWFDGGAHGPEQGGPDILPIVEKYQPQAIFYHNLQRADVRWGGSESGTVPYPCWGTFDFPSWFQHSGAKDNFKPIKYGSENGQYYMPAMADAPLRGYKGRHEWFWEPGDEGEIDGNVFRVCWP
jgi:alpha-L-fucosidase